ncbi:hypothetical protein AB0K09_23580 [Streptomyces sp. NPDC049577]|uniref:hypothetical protein n=1 Tax=Streptomyces sp. NPDC049577 TaxID=3155153 RepID=UPI0034329131
MTRTVAQQRSSAAKRQAVRAAAAVTAGLALVVGAAGAGQAATAGAPAAGNAPGCGALRDTAPASPAAAVPAAADTPSVLPSGRAGQKISQSLPAQLPIGLWSSSAITLRTPVTKGTVRLDVRSKGFSTDSLVVQRYEPKTRRWLDLRTTPSKESWPQHGVFTFPVTTNADDRHPQTTALRLQDLDRPGTLTVAASVTDGHGHTYRAPARTTTATSPRVTVSGWQKGVTLTRGGAARDLTLTVKNTTDRAYPALNASYYAYGAGKSHALAPKDLDLRQYQSGRGWVRVPLRANSCDPGMNTALRPVAKAPLAPGATVVYRLRIAVDRLAPRDVTNAEAGITVGNADQSFFSRPLPFAIRAK